MDVSISLLLISYTVMLTASQIACLLDISGEETHAIELIIDYEIYPLLLDCLIDG